jgi:hypothetical protein
LPEGNPGRVFRQAQIVPRTTAPIVTHDRHILVFAELVVRMEGGPFVEQAQPQRASVTSTEALKRKFAVPSVGPTAVPRRILLARSGHIHPSGQAGT